MLADDEGSLVMGRAMSQIAYAQLIAENAVHAQLGATEVDAVFEMLVNDLSNIALSLAAFGLCQPDNATLRQMIVIPKSSAEGWRSLAERAFAFGQPSGR